MQIRWGETDPRLGGTPLALTSSGSIAAVQVDGVEILVVSTRAQMLDLQQFQAFSIDPAAKRVVALKSMPNLLPPSNPSPVR